MIYQYKHIIILLLIINPLFLFSHNIIRGKVVCSNTNKALSGASIQLKSTNEGCSSDDWGNFTIDTDYESGILLVSYLGYTSQEIIFTSHTDFLLIEMKADIIDLGTLCVSGNSISPLNSISQLDIKVRNVKSSQDVLRIIPGLFIAQHAGGGKSEQIFVRGFDADHGTDISISVDGIPVNMVSQAHGQGYADLHFLIPELIKEVDFGKGSYYSNKGDFATAAYADFKTYSSIQNNLIKTELGMFNTFRTVGLFKLLDNQERLSGKNAFMAVEYYLSDGPFKSPQNFDRINLYTKYNHIVDQHSMFTFSASLFNSNWDQSGQLPYEYVNDGYLNRWSSLDPSEGGNTRRINLSLKSVHNLSDGGLISNQIYYTNYRFNLFSNFTFYLNDTVNGDQIQQKEARNLYGYEGKYSKKYSIKPNNTIEYTIGGGFRFDDINDSQLLNTYKRNTVIDTSNFGDINQSNINIYGQFDWNKNKLYINLGLRLNSFKFLYNNKLNTDYSSDQMYQNILSPKINLSYQISKKTQLYVKLGKGFHSNDARLVTQFDSLTTLPSSYGTDLGINLKPHSKLLINAALWYMYLEQEFVWSGDAGTWEPSGATNRLGLDLSLRWQIYDFLFFDLDINYCHARYTEGIEGQNFIPLAPSLTSTGGLSFRHRNSLNLELRYRFISDRPADEFNDVTAIGYCIIDFNSSYKLSKNWSVGISIENLLNSDWNEAQFASEYRVDPSARDEYGLTFTPGMPFFAKTVLEFSF